MVTLIAAMLLADAEPGPLDLSCVGGGAAHRVERSTGYGGNSAGQTGWATVQHPLSEAFDDQVDVHVDGYASRIRLPRTMLPPLHGGDHGWFKLKNVNTGVDAITGSASVNPLNNPKVYIDRRTGAISIDGKAGHYSGQCERHDPAAQERRF
jgi:hypothetical protein